MPEFIYKGRDKEGRLRVGQRFAFDENTLNMELIKEGISPIQITVHHTQRSVRDKLRDFFQGETLYLSELALFARQMQLLHDAGVPIVTALKQILSHSRSHRITQALTGIIEQLEKGQSLASSMQHYPDVFSPLIINIVQIGETTGRLSDAFENIHRYLEFEVSTIKQVRTAFRYPIFVLCAIALATIILNIFVIPTFARFYSNLEVSLPWQTRILIGTSHFFVHYGLYALIALLLFGYIFYRYIQTPHGKYQWNKFELRLPVIGRLLRRIILIRFCQSLSIILSSGISVTQGFVLVKNMISNTYVTKQIALAQESIERGLSFTQSIVKIDLFTSMEIQILAVGEKNGELSPALNYIGNFHSQEIAFDLKRMNDVIGPLLIGFISVLILIMALGIYLPIWNMINVSHR